MQDYQTENAIIRKNSGAQLYIEDPQKMIKWQTRRAVIVVSGVLILTALVIAFGIREINQLASAAEQKQNLIATVNANDLSVGKNWQTVLPYTKAINRALPSPDDLLAYQSALENAANLANVELTVNFAGQNSLTASGLKPVDHQLQIKGSLTQINDFLGQIERLPYYTKLTKFSITSQGGMAKESSASVSLQVETYIEKPAANLTPVPSPKESQ